MTNKYKYSFTKDAIEDLDNILSYITNQLNNQKAAHDLYISIFKEIERIVSFPKSFMTCEYYFIFDNTIRHALINNYLLFYQIDDEKNMITILRFRYSKMNFNDNFK